ncbi:MULTISPECIES: histidine phosphatase family protein [unclassified Brevundimonas]|uniref:SixA phosphatase family protein n=1 Tax=unclassified Brevundimonas TaxID=2622653 RepID=UPI0006F30B87|nr:MULTISPECIES: histidine phosphatase family protein [unclassified Brevundimonas]KQY86317.1 histidine phosphatase [Brevundimonas sp. Root1423]KRA26543.1 histidine phosphatase [Brevundimonas sp. Root608]
MQRLILMRHAEAERAASSGRDRDRALSVRGRQDAAAMGRALAARGMRPDLALVSPALRTRQTWDLLHDAFGDVQVREDEAQYNGGAHALRLLVEAAEDEAGCLMVVAHNPGVHLLAVEYLVESAASPSVLDRMSGGFPPGSAAIFTVDVAGRCAFEGFLQPRDLGGL